MFRAIGDYLRMIKFSHTIFALPLAGIAFVQAIPRSDFWAGGLPGWPLLWLSLKAIVAMAALRSAAMGFNRIVDRRYDALNPRTASRELPSGKISLFAAGAFTLLALAVYFAAAWSINWLCFALSPIAAAAALGYSYTKRFTWLCHFFLGAAIGLAPLGAWLALLARFDWQPAFWSAGLMCYIAGFDLLYACQDIDFDRNSGLHSLPARFGVSAALWTARLCHLLALVAFALAAISANAGAIFWLGLLVVAVLFFLEHWLVRGGRLDRIPLAFFQVNSVVSVTLFVFALADWFFRP